MRHPYKVILSGCDDETEMKVMLRKDEVLLLKALALLSTRTSTYGCMPILKIVKDKRKTP